MCIFGIFSAYLELHFLAYFEMLISASSCILCIYLQIVSLLADASFTFHSGTVWTKLVMWDFVDDSEPDSRFPGIRGRSLIGVTCGPRFFFTWLSVGFPLFSLIQGNLQTDLNRSVKRISDPSQGAKVIVNLQHF